MTDDPESIALDDLFELLGSEPRMELMRSLWNGFAFQDYVTGDQAATPFSTLFDRSSVADRGNFNYHLGALTDVLVRRTPDGYVLTPLGYNLMRVIERYEGFEYRELPPQPLEQPCPFCGDTLEGRYERELVHVRCTNCWGVGDDGTINYVQIPAASASDRSMERLLTVGTMEIAKRIRYTQRGICPDCSGTLDRELTIHADHATDADGRCSGCDGRFACTVDVACPACGWGGAGPVGEFALVSPRVRAAFDRHDMGPSTAGPWPYRLAAFAAMEETFERGDDPTIAFRFVVEDEAVTASFDGETIADTRTIE